jgi:hypothetical protein
MHLSAVFQALILLSEVQTAHYEGRNTKGCILEWGPLSVCNDPTTVPNISTIPALIQVYTKEC